jgi:CAAX protease family protein
VFGIGHGIWGVFGKSLRIAVGATVATSILGAMMAVVYITAGRSVAPCIVAHAIINAAIEPWLIMEAAGGSWKGTNRRLR